MNKFLLILKSLGFAALGGAVTAIATSAASGSISGNGIKGAAIGGALTGLGAYLKSSPLDNTSIPVKNNTT